jgi:hypothetical protein
MNKDNESQEGPSPLEQFEDLLGGLMFVPKSLRAVHGGNGGEDLNL